MSFPLEMRSGVSSCESKKQTKLMKMNFFMAQIAFAFLFVSIRTVTVCLFLANTEDFLFTLDVGRALTCSEAAASFLLTFENKTIRLARTVQSKTQREPSSNSDFQVSGNFHIFTSIRVETW